MEDIVDMHCHILPEVDDGAEGIEESLAMLRREREEGVRITEGGCLRRLVRR